MTSRETNVLAFIWYHEHEYEMLLRVTESDEELPETYDRWLVDARRAFVGYKRMGFAPERVYLDVEEFVDWCELRDRPVDKKAREIYKEIKRQEFYRQRDAGQDSDRPR